MPRSPELPSAKVFSALRARIEAGEWQPDQALPSVAVLAAEYGASRATVARVLRKLEADGLVRVIPRWGTFRS